VDEPEPEREPSLAERMEARLYDHENPPPKPEPRYFIDEVGICTAGNLTTIFAMLKVKVRGHREPVAMVGSLPSVSDGEMASTSPSAVLA
jgi:hypothetical protein